MDLTAAFERRAQDLHVLTAAALAQAQAGADPAVLLSQCDQVAKQVRGLRAISSKFIDISGSDEAWKAKQDQFHVDVNARGAHLMMLAQIFTNDICDDGDLDEVEAMATALVDAAQKLEAMVSEHNATYEAGTDAEDEARRVRRTAPANGKGARVRVLAAHGRKGA
jgi:hypothetical protein